MNQFRNFFRWTWSILVVCTFAFAMGGCEGDTGPAGVTGPAGADGADGADGAEGPQGPGAATMPLESCGVCHDDGSFAAAPDYHALAQIESVTGVGFAVNGLDLDVTFDLVVDGAPGLGYDTIERGYRSDALANADICNAPAGTSVCAAGSLTLTENGGGNYTLKVIGGAAAAATNYRYLFRVADGGARETRVYFYGDTPDSPFLETIVSADSCANCHGPEGIDVHGGYYQASDASEPCLVCHGVEPFWAPGTTVPDLVAVAHEYHSGLRDPITYPTYMPNCSVCHSDADDLLVVNAMPVSGEGCFTCHGDMNSPSWDFTNTPFHLAYDETTDCTNCHDDPVDGGIAPANVAEFHDGWESPRHGFVYSGVDTSIVEGDKFVWAITSMVDDGVDLTFTWEASYDGVPVDPCNDTVGAGAPTFHLGNGSLRTYRSYAQGDDFIIGTSTSAPGQPSRANPDATNTTCTGLIATTVIPAEAVAVEKGRIALGGKPRVISADVAGLEVEARVPSPTYDWLIGDGALVARRAIVDTELCVGCHVGSLYQHGGDRVDNVDYCLVCHNSASNEQYVRAGTMGIDPADTYDGQVGETFEMKTMIHRIHSAGEEGLPPYVIYRGRGVYGFATDDSLLPNWPGTGSQEVFGSTIDNDGNPGTYVVNHNFHTPTYPRSLNECTACHVDGSVDFQPDQTKAMATTREAGSTVWDDQVDDVLQGAATTACVTCHADGPAKGHAYQNSWTPQEFEEGRDTIIDAAN